MATDHSRNLVFSYLSLRKAIGFLGFFLPIVLAVGGWLIFDMRVQRSLSFYYHTPMGDVLVGTLFAIGFFLLSYKGYSRKDDLAGDLACIFAVGVALFPTARECGAGGIEGWIGVAHGAFSLGFFATLIYFSLFLFTKTGDAAPTPKKLKRNLVYRICGATMTLCIVLAAVYLMQDCADRQTLGQLNPVYWMETTAIIAFGISWIVKGEAILADAD